MAHTKFYRVGSLRPGQMANQCDIMTRDTYISQPMSLPSINFLQLTVSRIWLTGDFKVCGHSGKVKGQTWSHHAVAQLHHRNNAPSKYKHSTPRAFRDIIQTRFPHRPLNCPATHLPMQMHVNPDCEGSHHKGG